MHLPPHEPQQAPEGHYLFKVMEEPELRKKTSPSTGNEFVTVGFNFKLTDENGNSRYHRESFVPWDKRYRDLLIAFGAQEDKQGKVHLSEQATVIGRTFEADIIHEEDKDDPTKTWSRIARIKTNDDVPPPDEPNESEDEIPF